MVTWREKHEVVNAVEPAPGNKDPGLAWAGRL